MARMTATGSSTVQYVRRDAESAPLMAYLSPLAIVRTLVAHRRLLAQLSKTSLSSNHRGSLLGRAWVVLDPLIMLAVYGFVFGMIFASRGGRSDFVLGLYGGMLAYQIFSAAAVASASVVPASRNYVKQLVFPVEILPASTVGGVIIPSLIGFALLLIALLIVKQAIPWTAVLLPIIVLPVVLIALGSAWLFGALGVYVPDVRRIVALVAQVGFFITPIIWPIEQFPKDWAWVVHLNPLTAVVEGVRAVTLKGIQPDWSALGWSALFGLVLCQVGYAFFMKTKRGFADVL
jgi:lipopolysaccharide transport system permease protein